MAVSPKALQTFLPLPVAEFHILVALADGDCHGYGIMLGIARRTGGEVRLGPGTLYTAIGRLLREQLIEEVDESPGERRSERRRRSYRLTRLGVRVARAEAGRLQRLVRLANLTRLFSGAVTR